MRDDISITLKNPCGHPTGSLTRHYIGKGVVVNRDMGYSEDGPDKLAGVPGKWTEDLFGSSKSDLVNFVCSRKP